MQIEQKQNRIYKPQSVYTYAAEECNQVSTELENLITEGGLTPSAGDLTQVKKAVNNIVDTAANNLQSQIDAITSASDVFDVVGTYAQLQAYDKTTVPLNDIIKVLQDSTHNNAATYYRLVETSGATEWQYIGQEGPYYTKSEIDTDFALKSELPSIATVSQVGLIKPDNQSTFVGNDGTLTIASNVAAALPLFSFVWADHLLNDASYLRADTFSWQSGSVYTNAYNHLVNDIAGITQSTETIGSYTITYYLADDGHKIVLADQETTAQNIFNESGVAWYYLLDTDNIRFKLPRSKYAFVGLRDNVGKYVAESLPNITGGFGGQRDVGLAPYGAFYKTAGETSNGPNAGEASPVIKFDASLSSSTYQDNAPVQQRATQMYLYFYIGNFSQSAIEQTAGLNSSLFNGKVDLDGNNATFPHIVETYDDGNGTYAIVWSNGFCIQGHNLWRDNVAFNFPYPYKDTNYTIIATTAVGTGEVKAASFREDLKTTTSCIVYFSAASYYGSIYTCGYIS
ncbi:MAG: hypothetical protein K6E94_06455 [Elusimicrobiaceae bacterium]|nr:hypothetical protein [Elusimicrobiaceae bacterium]